MRLFKFLVVGTLNTLLGVASYGLFLRFGAPFPVASALSLALGIMVGFQAHRLLVFQRPGGFRNYLLVWVAIYGMANLLIWALKPYLGAFWAGVVILPANALVAYLSLRCWVFRPPLPAALPPDGEAVPSNRFPPIP